jgi:hypothetical protein
MSKLMIALFVSAGLVVAGSAVAQTYGSKNTSTPMSKNSYTMAKESAEAQYKVDNEACSPLSGIAKDICAAEAKGKYNVARSEAEAAYKHTARARENARVAHAQAAYDVAIERCDGQAGSSKDVCVKEADAALVKARAEAKVDRVTADTHEDAAAKQADARKDANADKRNAEYKVAIEKCDALAAPAKDACISKANMQYGKS